jgi:autotransporter strand-loop-strand O-heptosyltransferase
VIEDVAAIAAPVEAETEAPPAPETESSPAGEATSALAVEAPPVAATIPASAASGSAAAKPAYPVAPETPTQHGPNGVRFDFNEGCRVVVPEAGMSWRVRLMDLDTGNTLFETSSDFTAGRVTSAKRYYVRFRVEVWLGDEQLVNHDYDARDREIAVIFPVGTLGDTMGWFPYAVKFQEQHGCRLTCAMAERLIPLFAEAYPQISFVSHEDFEPTRYCATYRIGLFFDDKECLNQPCDFRLVGLHRTAGYILGVDPTEMAPRLAIPDDTRPIDDRHRSSCQAASWAAVRRY